MLNVEKTELEGVYLIRPSAHEDAGQLLRDVQRKEYQAAGLTAKFIQDDISKSVKGVLKGMHGDPGTYKLVQCVYGSVYAVILNCDEASQILENGNPSSCRMRINTSFISRPCRETGYYVLSDTAVYSYKQSTYYGEYKQFTYKWNDPRFSIKWPAEATIMSERDA